MIELGVASLMAISAFYGGVPDDIALKSTPTAKVGFLQGNNLESKKAKAGPLTLEAYTKSYFVDTPILVEIAKCESHYTHFGKNGKVIRGIVNSSDIGIMQINEYYHGDTAKALDLDIHTLSGNMSYAKWLYEKYGSDPWVHSSKCWGKKASELALKN
ncbi:MAG: hypothetical protein COV70_04085 [Parcubacteria group bacterium CG11_big_fil_rev_8_21_14_0_20_39_22]|nr:MAG: hypothetical protein COV70_04085 [Parcubacteria group bacterium CG11_big_fil_rev_8_21_14_0_20_39_22]